MAGYPYGTSAPAHRTRTKLLLRTVRRLYYSLLSLIVVRVRIKLIIDIIVREYVE